MPAFRALPLPPALRGREWWGSLALGLALLGVVSLALIPLWGFPGAGWGYDFRAYFDAAQRLLTSGSPYQAETLAGPFRPGPGGLYLYSPIPALLLVPLTALGVDGATLAWFIARLALFVAACALLPASRSTRLAVFGVAAVSVPFLYDLNLGNVSIVVTFLAVVGWRWLDRPIGAMAIAASLFVRPTMALVGGWWLLRRRWRTLLWLVATGLVLIVASLPFVGLDGWQQYATVTSNLSEVTGVKTNADLASSALSLGVPGQLTVWFLAGGYLLAVATILLSLRRDRVTSYVVAVMATLLLSPLLWLHYLTLLILPAALLAERGHRWAVLLPVLGSLPTPALPLAAIAGLLLPFLPPEMSGSHRADDS
jgi:hypothetical protein